MRTPPRALVLTALLALALAACGADGPAEEAADLEDAAQTPVDEPAATEDDETTPGEDPTEDAGAEDDADAEDEDAGTGAEDGDEDDAGDGDADAVVAVGMTDLGNVLVDGDGMTLYMFEPDQQGAPTCNDDCAESWPPLLTEGEPTADGEADAALLGTAERDDGATQVTYDGWPLYRWAADEEPGDASGQGVGDVWWVLDADGEPQRDGDEAAAAEEDQGQAADY